MRLARAYWWRCLLVLVLSSGMGHGADAPHAEPPRPAQAGEAKPASQPSPADTHNQEAERPAPSPAAVADALESSNLLTPEQRPPAQVAKKDHRFQIDTARQLRRAEDYTGASKMIITLLEEELPADLQRAALFELALVAEDEKRFSRAQQILAQYLKLFPEDPTVPEVLLRQGLIFRQMGAYQMALVKYYAVMNSALNMKLDEFGYYKRLVLQAQTEIADTYYMQGKFSEASDFFGRILKQDAPELNRPLLHFKLIRCLSALGKHPDVIIQADKFFEQHPAASETPELRFLCASSLKKLGRSSEALSQVLKLLESQQSASRTNAESWVYWQQRAGNEIANQLYIEGDYLHALQIYEHISLLDPNLAWQLPVQYQLGLIYERLGQPQKATAAFNIILGREKEVIAAGAEPGLKTILEMAKFRKEQLGWQGRTQVAVQSLRLSPPPPSAPTTSPPPPPPPQP